MRSRSPHRPTPMPRSRWRPSTWVSTCCLRSRCTVDIVQSAAAHGPPAGMTRIVGDRGTLWLGDGDVVWLADPSHPTGRAVPVPPDLELPLTAGSDDPRHRFTHLELAPYTRLCEQLAIAIAGG